MKKKLLITMMTMIMGLSMVACGNNDDFYNTNSGCGVDYESEDVEGNITADNAQLETTIESETFDIKISTLDDGDEVLNRLKEEFGDPTDSTECNDIHTDTFDDLEVTYSEDSGKKTILEFKCISDKYKTSKGITIGSTVDEVKAAYGDPSNEYDCDEEHYIDYYYTDGFSIYFICANNEVITYQIVMGRG